LSHEMMKPWERRLSLMAERNMCNVAMRDIVVVSRQVPLCAVKDTGQNSLYGLGM